MFGQICMSVSYGLLMWPSIRKTLLMWPSICQNPYINQTQRTNQVHMLRNPGCMKKNDAKLLIRYKICCPESAEMSLVTTRRDEMRRD
jgi:hypothetical protein